MVKDGYNNDVKTSAPLEQKYTLKGNYEVSYYEQDANNKQWKKYEIWYPTEMETSEGTYPVVVMVNGTGVAASKYKPIFEHLASWGVIVIGNEDESAGNGASAWTHQRDDHGDRKRCILWGSGSAVRAGKER